jgi:hypothetical protein
MAAVSNNPHKEQQREKIGKITGVRALQPIMGARNSVVGGESPVVKCILVGRHISPYTILVPLYIYHASTIALPLPLVFSRPVSQVEASTVAEPRMVFYPMDFLHTSPISRPAL